MEDDSDLKKDWKDFCLNNSIKYIEYDPRKVNKYIANLSLKNYDNSLREFTTKSIVICPKCKDNNVDWHGVQTRRADEAQTIFCQCRNEDCKHTFRF